MNREKVLELLKNYRSYVAAIRNYERKTQDEMETNPYMSAAPCRIASYGDMPGGGGFGSRTPVLTGGWGLADAMLYRELSKTVRYITEALDALPADGRDVIVQKWMHGLTLDSIAERKGYSVNTIKRMHKQALRQLEISLVFVDAPQLEKVTA